MAQGTALIEAAKGCSTLEHFVFQTMTRFQTHPEDIGQHSPIHFRTKWQLEEMIKDAGLPWTMLRQPAYMRQIKFGLRGKKRISYPYPPGTKLVYVAEKDIGKVLAQLFRDRERFLHKEVKVCSEVLTPEELTLRASRAVPSISPKYKQASRLYSAFFDHVVVGIKPAFRYVSQINGNLIVGNCFDMSDEDQRYCADLISPLELTTMEDWLREEVATD